MKPSKYSTPELPSIDQLMKTKNLNKEIDNTLDDLEVAQTKLDKNIVQATEIVCSIFKESDKFYWKSIQEIVIYTGLKQMVVSKVLEIDNGKIFCENRNNLITTREMYEKRRSFKEKLLDAFANGIR